MSSDILVCKLFDYALHVLTTSQNDGLTVSSVEDYVRRAHIIERWYSSYFLLLPPLWLHMPMAEITRARNQGWLFLRDKIVDQIITELQDKLKGLLILTFFLSRIVDLRKNDNAAVMLLRLVHRQARLLQVCRRLAPAKCFPGAKYMQYECRHAGDKIDRVHQRSLS
jgi:hypothetical protein